MPDYADVVAVPSAIELRPFEARWAATISRWVPDDDALRLLAPGTQPPLTPAKVANWIKPGGFAVLGCLVGMSEPIAYGEINPMRRRVDHYWLGHVMVSPDFRRRGYGLTFVRMLLQKAFQSRKAREVALIVFPENIGAIECYLRAGFRMAGEEHHQFLHDGPHEKLLRMEVNSARLRSRRENHRVPADNR